MYLDTYLVFIFVLVNRDLQTNFAYFPSCIVHIKNPKKHDGLSSTYRKVASRSTSLLVAPQKCSKIK